MRRSLRNSAKSINKSKEQRPVDMLDEKPLLQFFRKLEFILPHLIFDQRESRVLFHRARNLGHEDQGCKHSAGADRGDQISEYRQYNNDHHDPRVAARRTKQMSKAAIVDDAQ